MPYSQFDKTLAFFERWKIIVFPETFEQDDKRTDPMILDKISTDDELSGLFNWAVCGLKRLLNNYHFTKTSKENEDEIGGWYETLRFPERQFFVDKLELCDGNNICKDEVFVRYEKWARLRGYPVLTVTSFTRNLKKFFNASEESKSLRLRCDTVDMRLDGRKVKGYRNLCWKMEESVSQKDIDFFKPESFIGKDVKEGHILKNLDNE
jgi:phage/plasmid-associated DNA primase